MKILIIDPRCVDASSSYYYVTGLASGLSKHADVTLVSVKKCHIESDAGFALKNIFYPLSQSMRRGIIRQLLRGIEYLIAYIYLYLHTKTNKYDVIHIEWPIVYKIDKVFYRLLKKNVGLFTLKAHNVLPHATGDKFIDAFREIYAIPDKIILHGEGMKTEFVKLFPEYSEKVVIQHHGIYTGHNLSFSEERVAPIVRERVSKSKRVYLFYGRIDADKGVDRLVRIWERNMDEIGNLLVIAGKVNPEYSSFTEVEKQIKNCDSILYLPGYVEDNLLNYLITKADLIVMPYVKGSMSGVAFTAAEFSKPILTTRFGSIEEYIVNGETGYVVENEDTCIASKLNEVDKVVTNRELEQLGKNMHSYFEENYQWDAIADKLINEVYSKF